MDAHTLDLLLSGGGVLVAREVFGYLVRVRTITASAGLQQAKQDGDTTLKLRALEDGQRKAEREDVRAMGERLGRLEGETSRLAQDNLLLHQTNERLAAERNRLEAELAAAIAALHARERTIAEMHAEIITLVDSNEKLRELVNSLTERIQTLTERLEALAPTLPPS